VVALERIRSVTDSSPSVSGEFQVAVISDGR